MTSLRYLTSGESHGPALNLILEGMPAGVPITLEAINHQLLRRQKGYGRGGRMKIETDQAIVMSGIRHGKTLGSPIAIRIENKDWNVWQQEMSLWPISGDPKREVTSPRPGHADLSGGLKYNFKDLRNVLERASARETTSRVAVGALCRQLLEHFGFVLAGHVVAVGDICWDGLRPSAKEILERTEEAPMRCLDPQIETKMMARVDEAKKAGDSVGGVFEVIVEGVPPGLGSHVHWDRKLDGRLAQALCSIQAVKGVEIGEAFRQAHLPGSQVHDGIFYNAQQKKFFHKTNRAGGLEGGMTNGEPLILRGALKPIATLYTPLHSVDVVTKKEFEAAVERSDTCVVPAASVIAENVVAITLADAFLEKFGGDSLDEIRHNYEAYLQQIHSY
ncbi:MAG: chorismate synthase [Deltaproteobacteria bacterium]|nr:chorismate synthase [Deltaproteobacteria bacterium]